MQHRCIQNSKRRNTHKIQVTHNCWHQLIRDTITSQSARRPRIATATVLANPCFFFQELFPPVLFFFFLNHCDVKRGRSNSVVETRCCLPATALQCSDYVKYCFILLDPQKKCSMSSQICGLDCVLFLLVVYSSQN